MDRYVKVRGPDTCKECGGYGTVGEYRYGKFWDYTCPVCKGTGKKPTEDVLIIGGQGE